MILLFEAITEQTYKENNKNNKKPYTKTKEKLKRAYGRIGLTATVTRTQEMRKTKLELKRNSY